MRKMTKILLALSLVSFLISTTGALRGQFLPFGAILFGLFMISRVLEKEAALFDEEQALRTSLASKNTPASSNPQKIPNETSLSAAPAR